MVWGHPKATARTRDTRLGGTRDTRLGDSSGGVVVLGIGYCVLGIGYWVLGIGYWVLGIVMYVKIKYLKTSTFHFRFLGSR